MTDSTFDTLAIVGRCADLVRDKYVFADIGDQLATTLVQQLADGAYSAATTPAELAAAVTVDLQAVNGDKHLRLKHHVDPLVDLTDDAATMAAHAAEAREAMGGVARVERLAGNVGLLELAPALFPASVVGPSIAAAMTLLADTSALVIDLREMRGGDPGTVALICSYFVDEPTHLNSMVPRDRDQATQSWTLPWVPGPRFGTRKPVWVLTSSTTFSGGEELAYDLQQLGRAKIFGEPTGGGAHAREGFDVHPHLEFCVPIVAARNAVSGANWEGTGVQPDVAVPAGDALTVAHRAALDALAGDTALSPALRREIDQRVSS